MSLFTPIQGLTRKAFLPHVSVLYRANTANLSTSLRVGTRQTSRFATVAQSAKKTSTNGFFKTATVGTLGLGLAIYQSPVVKCEAPLNNAPASRANLKDLPPPPQSSVSLYELGFGTVTGICAGIFMKKGAKAIAWLLGGIFVLLQYLASQSLVRVDWSRMASRFENNFSTGDATTGARKPLTVGGLWRWLIEFLTADFQPRASFIAGFALGLRVG